MSGANYYEAHQSDSGNKLARLVGIKPLHEEFADYGSERSVHASFTLSLVAEGLGADILVTNRPVILEGFQNWFYSFATLTPETVIPLLGLFARLSGVFPIRSAQRLHLTTSKWTYFWLAARSLLPSARELLKNSGDQKGVGRVAAVVDRLSWAIAARDSVLFALSRENQDKHETEMLVGITQLLVWLQSAFDAVALVIRDSRNLRLNEIDASLHRKTFYGELISQGSEDVARYLKKDSHGALVLEIVSTLRNTVHADPFSSVGLSDNGRSNVNLVSASVGSKRRMLFYAMGRTGGPESWGYDETLDWGDCFYPHVLMEKLLEESFTLINLILHCLVPDPSIEHSPAQSTDEYMLSLESGRKIIRSLGFTSWSEVLLVG